MRGILSFPISHVCVGFLFVFLINKDYLVGKVMVAFVLLWTSPGPDFKVLFSQGK